MKVKLTVVKLKKPLISSRKFTLKNGIWTNLTTGSKAKLILKVNYVALVWSSLAVAASRSVTGIKTTPTVRCLLYLVVVT